MEYVECGAFNNGYFKRNFIIPDNKVFDFRFQYNNIGVFKTVYSYDSENQATATLSGDFYIDLDIDFEENINAFDIIRRDVKVIITYLKKFLEIRPEDINFYFSGSKGFHIIVPKEVFGNIKDKNLNSIYKMLVVDINKYTSKKTIDLRIYDRKRLFRMVNSRHQKTMLYKISVSYKEILTLPLDEIKALAKEPRVIPKKQVRYSQKAYDVLMDYKEKFLEKINKPVNNTKVNIRNFKYVPPCVEYLLNNPVSKGNRNNTTAFLSSFFMQQGYTEEQIIDIISEWNEAKCSPSLSMHEIKATINCIISGNARMGCSTAKDLSLCDQSICKLHNKGGNEYDKAKQQLTS